MLVCVCQSDPPGHKASTSRPVAFQPEASFSFTAGGKQTNTRENSNKTVETWWTTEKKKKTYTLPVFVWGVEKHSQRGLLDYYCCKNKEQNTENNMCKIRLMTFLSLKKAFCWCYDFVLPMCWSMICWLYSKTGISFRRYLQQPAGRGAATGQSGTVRFLLFSTSRRVIDQCAWLLLRALRRCSPWRGMQRRTCTPARL